MMVPSCTIPHNYRINTTMVFHEMYAMCYWLRQNVLGVSYMFSFYMFFLHVVHYFTTNDASVCMRRLLFSTIVARSYGLDLHCPYHA